MRYVVVLMLLLALGCVHEAPPAPVPPPPEDLSTWTVPEVVQPPAPLPTAPPLVQEKPTAAEKVYAYTPGTPYTVPVPVGWPLDIVLERGEQVHNIVGGDRAPGASTPAPHVPARGDPTER